MFTVSQPEILQGQLFIEGNTTNTADKKTNKMRNTSLPIATFFKQYFKTQKSFLIFRSTIFITSQNDDLRHIRSIELTSIEHLKNLVGII